MLVSPIQYTQTHGHVKCISIVNRHQKKILWWFGLVPALVKWLLPFIIWLSCHYQKSKEDPLMTVASGGEVGTSCEWRSESQTAAELWRHPTKTRCRPFYITIVPLSLSFSRCLFLQHEDFAGFFSLLKLRCPWMASPPPLVAYFLFEEL